MAVVGVEPSDVRLVLPADEISNPSIMKKKGEKWGKKHEEIERMEEEEDELTVYALPFGKSRI